MDPMHEATDSGAPESDAFEPEPELPSLPMRALQAFVSPGLLMERLAADPRWVAMLLLGTGVATLAAALIPPELTYELIRIQMLESGADFPAMTEETLALFRWGGIAATAIQMLLLTFVFALFYFIVFAFILGDEGRFTQYLAALTHAWFIPPFLGLLMVPLWITTGNLELRPNAASFFFFLPDGVLMNALTALDLTHIWATLVFAQGAHAIDNRRSFSSAATIGVTVLFVLVLVLGWVQTLGQQG